MNMRAMLVTLIVAATALLVAGISAERSAGRMHNEAAGGSAESGGTEVHADEASEAAAGGESETGERSGSEEGTLFGLEAESTPLLALAAALSLALASAVWLVPRSGVVLVVAATAMGLFAALDVRELVHQLDEGAGLLTFLAGLVAALHAAAALVALAAARAVRVG